MALGRPRKEVDWDQVDKMCQIQCTAEEMAHVLGVSEDTLSRRCQETHDITIADYIKQHRSEGKMSLRRWQMEAAKKGNAALLIWLGKQYLGQREDYNPESDKDRIRTLAYSEKDLKGSDPKQ